MILFDDGLKYSDHLNLSLRTQIPFEGDRLVPSFCWMAAAMDVLASILYCQIHLYIRQPFGLVIYSFVDFVSLCISFLIGNLHTTSILLSLNTRAILPAFIVATFARIEVAL